MRERQRDTQRETHRERERGSYILKRVITLLNRRINLGTLNIAYQCEIS